MQPVFCALYERVLSALESGKSNEITELPRKFADIFLKGKRSPN